MSLMCTGCFEVKKFYEVIPYEGKPYHPYKVGACECGGNVCEVDELILPTIIELNRKGWTTKFCCSGHMNEGHICTYIYFEELPPNLPTGFEVRSHSDTAIYYKMDRVNLRGLEGFERLLRINRNLYSWATRLPERIETNG